MNNFQSSVLRLLLGQPSLRNPRPSCSDQQVSCFVLVGDCTGCTCVAVASCCTIGPLTAGS